MSMEAARAHLEQFGLEGRIRLGGRVQGLAAGGITSKQKGCPSGQPFCVHKISRR